LYSPTWLQPTAPGGGDISSHFFSKCQSSAASCLFDFYPSFCLSAVSHIQSLCFVSGITFRHVERSITHISYYKTIPSCVPTVLLLFLPKKRMHAKIQSKYSFPFCGWSRIPWLMFDVEGPFSGLISAKQASGIFLEAKGTPISMGKGSSPASSFFSSSGNPPRPTDFSLARRFYPWSTKKGRGSQPAAFYQPAAFFAISPSLISVSLSASIFSSPLFIHG